MKKISRADQEIINQFKTSRDGDEKKIKTCNETHDEQETCLICQDDLSTKVFVLNCKHKFHRDCLKNLRNPSCPQCRAPITSDVMPEAKEMDRRRRRDIEDNNRRAAEELESRLNIVKIVIGTSDWKTAVMWMLENVGIARLQSQDNLNDDQTIHSGLHNLLPLYNCRSIFHFIDEMQIFYRAAEMNNITVDTRMVNWFSERLLKAYYGSELTHAMAHWNFPQARCVKLSFHELVALKKMYKTHLPID